LFLGMDQFERFLQITPPKRGNLGNVDTVAGLLRSG
jgi:hypothetical protein